jgi:hypothetical protein
VATVELKTKSGTVMTNGGVSSAIEQVAYALKVSPASQQGCFERWVEESVIKVERPAAVPPDPCTTDTKYRMMI